MDKVKCPKCSGKKFWKVRRGKIRCKNCRYEFKIKKYPLNLNRYEWKKLLKWFLISGRVKMIKEQTGLSGYKVLKCCNKIREIMQRDIPKSFEGIGTSNQPVFGILCRDGRVWARLIDGVEKKDLQPLIENRVKKGAIGNTLESKITQENETYNSRSDTRTNSQ